MTGRFIAVEGADGTSKSTQARLLADRLGALFTREPGGTPLGEHIRDLVLDPTGQGPVDRAEALLMAAARAQHVDLVVVPALAAGRDVVSDRFVASSMIVCHSRARLLPSVLNCARRCTSPPGMDAAEPWPLLSAA